MFIGLLKCPKSSLESEWHPTVPSRGTLESRPFGSIGPPIFMEAEICVHDLYPKLSNLEVTVEKHTSAGISPPPVFKHAPSIKELMVGGALWIHEVYSHFCVA